MLADMIYQIYKRLPLVFRSFTKVLQRLAQGIRQGQGLFCLKVFWDLLGSQSRLFVDAFYEKTGCVLADSDKFRRQIQGLHSLLPQDSQFSYSILIALDHPNPKYFRETLQSVLQLTAPRMEILVGYQEGESAEVLAILDEFHQKAILCSGKTLESHATGAYLVPVGQEDLVRCDLLYRYEQVLRSKPELNGCVLCTHEYEIDSRKTKFEHRSLLIPAELGLSYPSKTEFFCIPFPLYGSRKRASSQNIHAAPDLDRVPKIQVIIPFKNQKELTLKAIESVLLQQGVDIIITAVDNDSEDHTISLEIERRGGEVIHVQEPFNFSRLNNIAVRNTRKGKECDLVLFMNNDVELQEGALIEMARFAYLQEIGIVGCRLYYPNGLLQHGGLTLDLEYPATKRAWVHTEKGMESSRLEKTAVPGIVDGVTAACAMMRKNLFLDVGGFDEILYPISYSDTNLCERIRARGYHCFYTPYAVGIHYESVSRSSGSLEEIESSAWLKDIALEKSNRDFAKRHVEKSGV